MFILGSIVDYSLTNKIYKVKAPASTIYSFKSNNKITLKDKNNILIDNENNKKVNLIKDKVYTLIVNVVNNNINIEVDSNYINIPYLIKTKKPLINGYVKYHNRKGGTYLYNNHPESIKDNALNKILMHQDKLKGKCFLTFENQNNTSKKEIYLGYRLFNPTKKDVYVTVTNLGYQVKGSWLGEISWQDYYQVKYDINKDNFKDKITYYGKEFNSHEWYHDYLNFNEDYEVEKHNIITYKIKPNDYLFIIGGKSKDNHDINVLNSANKPIETNCCANGNMLFIVNNGYVKGDFICYDDYSKIDNHCRQMIKYFDGDDLGGRMGYINHHGVIDGNFKVLIDDNTKTFKFTYFNKYAPFNKNGTPGKKLEHLRYHKQVVDGIYTNLSSIYHHEYYGFDITDNYSEFENKKIKLSIFRYNPVGKIWDAGNWMFEYQDNYYIKNISSKEKTIKLSLDNAGSLFYMIKDKDNNILKKAVTLNTCSQDPTIYEITLKPKEKRFINLTCVLPANNNGSMVRKIKVKE